MDSQVFSDQLEGEHMPPETEHTDQTSEDVVTGVDFVDGVLIFRRANGSTLEVPIPEA